MNANHHSYSFRSRTRSRSRRRERSFQCEKCPGRAYETERGLINHQQRYCGKPKEEGVFPCNHCDRVFVTLGLLSMHKGRFHTDRSSTRDGVGTSMERPNLIDDNKGQAVDSQGEYNGKVPRSYEANVEGMVTSKGGSSENNNSVHLRNQSVSRGQDVCHNVNGASGNKKLSNGCWEIRNQPTFSFYDDHSHLLCSRTEHRNTNFRNWDAR